MRRFLLALVGFGLSSCLSAQTTYMYTGLPMARANFTPPCATGPCAGYPAGATIKGWFSTAIPLPGGLSAVDVYPKVTGYSFSDGINTYSSENPNSRVAGFLMSTDAGGNITAFAIVVELWQTGSSPHVASDRFAAIQLNTAIPVIGTVNNQGCAVVGVSIAGMADTCTTGQPFDGSTSRAGVQPFAPGAWSRLVAPPVEYTDVYFDPAESGRGAFLVHSDTFQFMALFIHGPDGNPTWYTAEMALAADGTSYSGPLYRTTGTYFGLPWDPGKAVSTQAGTASFTPVDNYHASIVYAVDGAPSVTMHAQRQMLLPYPMSGDYSGSLAGTVTGCKNSAENDNASQARFGLRVTQVNDDSITLEFSLIGEDAGIVCTVSGPLTHLGRLYRVAGGQLSCTDDPGGHLPATIEALHATDQGIEGRLLFAEPVAGCLNNLSFSAVRGSGQQSVGKAMRR